MPSVAVELSADPVPFAFVELSVDPELELEAADEFELSDEEVELPELKELLLFCTAKLILSGT